jgi:glutamate synthase (NADPH/NADH) large chain
VSGLYRVDDGGAGLRCGARPGLRQASEAIDDGARIIVLSDRNADSDDAPIPSLLLTAAVHHHLVRTKQRTMAGLIVEAGDAREVHHMALLIGYGAGAINPYLAFESIEDLIAEDMHGLGAMDPQQAVRTTSRPAARACSR